MEPKRTRLALLLLADLSIGCGAVRNPALEYAREAYQKARQDPVIVRHAAVALDRARRTLEEADRLWTKEQDILEVEHLAYIVEKRVEIARVTRNGDWLPTRSSKSDPHGRKQTDVYLK